VAALCLKQLPVGNGAGDQISLHLLRQNDEWGRDQIGLHLREVTEIDRIERRELVSGLELPHSCKHGGPPEESRPCAVQAEAAIQWAYRAREANPSRL